MPPEHLCYDSYWGMWAPPLVYYLDQIAPGDAVNLTLPTYSALVSLQQDLEFTLDVRVSDIPEHQGHGTNLSLEEEAELRALILHFQVGLIDDRFDATPNSGCHAPGAPPGWILSGNPQKSIVDAVRVLSGQGNGPVPPFCPNDGVLGRVKNVLGS